METQKKYRHALDLEDFIEMQSEKISEFLEKTGGANDDLQNDKNWLSEQILLLFIKWATGITPTVVQQDVLIKAGQIRQGSHAKVGQMNVTPAIHGIISSVGFFPETKCYTIRIEQRGYQHSIQAAVHNSLLPFVNRFIACGRKIHIANARFANDIIIPNQLVVIDLMRTKMDVDFIMQETTQYSLKKVTKTTPIPNALLLRVLSATATGVLVTDDSVDLPMEFYLDKERQALKLLLRFNDVIIIYRPEITITETEHMLINYGPNTVIFRVPVTGDMKNSQFTQRSSTLSQDGLLFRNSTACRSLHGTVLSVQHLVAGGSWKSSNFVVHSSEGRNERIMAPMSDTPAALHRTIATLRPGHYIWSFGLYKHENSLLVNAETTLFNTSFMHSAIASDVAVARPLKVADRFTTFVARAVIVSVEAELQQAHSVCEAVVVGGTCPFCRGGRATDAVDSELVVRMKICDGSSEPVEVASSLRRLPFWGVSVAAWKNATREGRAAMTRRLLGHEFLFALSMATEAEFGGFTDSPLWRVDLCIAPVGECERHVGAMMEWHRKLDSTSQIEEM